MMRFVILASGYIGFLVSLAEITHAVHLPEHAFHAEGQLQQDLAIDIPTIDAFETALLNNPHKLQRLLSSLTSDDVATQALDELSTMNLNSLQAPIVLNNRDVGKRSISNKLFNKGSGHPASLEISMSTIGGFPVYHAPIAIGHPAQPFRAWLNLDLNGVYVRSSACSMHDCGKGFTYDPRKSTTRSSVGDRFEVHPKDWKVGGEVSTDGLHLVSIDVEDATIGEVDTYEGEDLFYYVMEFVVDGALGLAPPASHTSAYSPLKSPNPLYELVSSKMLKHNTLTFTLPLSTRDTGSLQIGAPPQLQEGTVRVPFENTTNPTVSSTWNVALASVSLVGHAELHLPLESVHARLDLEPAIRLPPSTTKAIYEAIGAKPNSLFYGASIDCRARSLLPDLTLNVGGEQLTLTKDEYSSEQMVYGHPVCVVAILPSESEDVAVLGTNLLAKYHVMIDLDSNELRLITRNLSE